MSEICFDVDVALSEVPVNIMPLIDDTDFKTREESVVYNQSGLDLVWNFVTTAGAFTQTAVTPTNTGGDYDWVNQGNGMYSIEIPASGGASINNDTEGFGWFTGFATGILPWRGPICTFRAANINDALIDSDTLLTSGDINLVYEGVITTVTSQTEYDSSGASIGQDDIYNGMSAHVYDTSTGDFWPTWVTATNAANNRITVAQAPPFTVVTTDKIRVFGSRDAQYVINTYDPPTNAELGTTESTILDRLLGYFQLALRSDSAITTDRSAELALINTNEGSGAGDYAATSESQEAIRDKADTDGTNISAIKTKTDSLTFTVSNQVDANIQSVDDVTIGESGTGNQGFGSV